MCWNEICRDLTAVNETVSDWSAGVPVSELEKDVVLEKLRAVYSQIKSAECGEICPAPAPEVIADEDNGVHCETAGHLADAVKKRKVLLSLYEQEKVEQEEAPAPHNAKAERHTTLGEAFVHNTKDISSEINCAHLDTLSGAIGINDKFMMIRDLFEGDATAYEAAMQTFESFRDLDDAMVYIYENYNWDPDSTGVTMLVDLLTRKLA